MSAATLAEIQALVTETPISRSLVRITDTRSSIGIGRDQALALIRSGAIHAYSVSDSAEPLVAVEELERWMDTQPTVKDPEGYTANKSVFIDPENPRMMEIHDREMVEYIGLTAGQARALAAVLVEVADKMETSA